MYAFSIWNKLSRNLSLCRAARHFAPPFLLKRVWL